MVNAGMTTAYGIAIAIGLLVAYFMNSMVPNLNPFIKFFIIPFLVIYILLLLFRLIFPGLNRAGRKFRDFVGDNAANDIYAMSYVQIFPPIFIVFILIIILLYSGMFSK